MRKTMILAAIAALAFTSAADAKSCKDASGKFIKCPSAAAAQTTAKAMTAADTKSAKANAKAASKNATSAAPNASTAGGKAVAAAPMATASKKAPHCVKGKACGNSCIKMTDVCHK